MNTYVQWLLALLLATFVSLAHKLKWKVSLETTPTSLVVQYLEPSPAFRTEETSAMGGGMSPRSQEQVQLLLFADDGFNSPLGDEPNS